MNVVDAAQEIRETVSMETVLGYYGYKTQHGFMRCPFHGDHQGSLKVYKGNKGWHCFGCGKGGSVIDFVMEHDGKSFPDAVRTINREFGLNLPLDTVEFFVDLTYQKQKVIREAADEAVELSERADRMAEAVIRYCLHEYNTIADIPREERTAEQWTRMLQLNDWMQRLEYEKEREEQYRREVRQWQRRIRKLMLEPKYQKPPEKKKSQASPSSVISSRSMSEILFG